LIDILDSFFHFAGQTKWIKMDERMPDPDAIKMFVGQLPKGWNENDVKKYFESFGQIYLINVLRDKVTKQSRGKQ